MKYFLIIFLTFCICNCKEKDANLENTNIKNLEFIDVEIHNNCNLYLLFFRNGSTIGKINTSGNCEKLKSESYYKAYEKLLRNNIKKIPKKSGKLIFELYNNDPILISKLNDITKIYFKSKNVIISQTEKELILEIE